MHAPIPTHRAEMAQPERARPACPLVVDVDGTLVRTDLLHETLVQFAISRPLHLWRLPGWLVAGRHVLKSRLASEVEVDVLTVPLEEAVLTLIREAQRTGRQVYLASASNRRLVEALAVRLGGVAGIFASDDRINLAGAAKAARLVEAFGKRGFDYVGDHAVDLPIWNVCDRAIAAPGTAGVQRRLLAARPDALLIEQGSGRSLSYLRCLRPHQWAKNLLLLVPFVTVHRSDPQAMASALLAMIAFCCAASSAYLLNDIVDLCADRAHPRKRKRPFAAGDVPILHGMALSAALLTTALVLGSLLSPAFLMLVTVYVVTTFAYSFSLKRQLVVDVATLSGLYTLRVFAGAAVIGTRISPWLLMFCLFIFLGLATLKRCSELVLNRERGDVRIAGRGYRTADLPVMTALGAAASYGAVLIYALYISSGDVTILYRHSERLWAGCPLLLAWLSRLLLLSGRGEIDDDPLVFALRDRFSLATGLLFASTVAVSI